MSSKPDKSADGDNVEMTTLARIILPIVPVHPDFKNAVRKRAKRYNRRVTVIDALFPTYTCVQMFIGLVMIFLCLLIGIFIQNAIG